MEYVPVRSILREKGGCCGGGSALVKKEKKKLHKIIAQKTFIIEGMTCDHCKNRVEKCINDMNGVAAKVNLKKKEAIVSFEKMLTKNKFKQRLKKLDIKL